MADYWANIVLIAEGFVLLGSVLLIGYIAVEHRRETFARWQPAGTSLLRQINDAQMSVHDVARALGISLDRLQSYINGRRLITPMLSYAVRCIANEHLEYRTNVALAEIMNQGPPERVKPKLRVLQGGLSSAPKTDEIQFTDPAA